MANASFRSNRNCYLPLIILILMTWFAISPAPCLANSSYPTETLSSKQALPLIPFEEGKERLLTDEEAFGTPSPALMDNSKGSTQTILFTIIMISALFIGRYASQSGKNGWKWGVLTFLSFLLFYTGYLSSKLDFFQLIPFVFVFTGMAIAHSVRSRIAWELGISGILIEVIMILIEKKGQIEIKDLTVLLPLAFPVIVGILAEINGRNGWKWGFLSVVLFIFLGGLFYPFSYTRLGYLFVILPPVLIGITASQIGLSGWRWGFRAYGFIVGINFLVLIFLYVCDFFVTLSIQKELAVFVASVIGNSITALQLSQHRQRQSNETALPVETSKK
ncbi:MAG: hypothetical protein PHD48_06360 [Alphaproteobacteria bacterium]|nr:hypothetical protein [Alphaproteobacteria bacterium]